MYLILHRAIISRNVGLNYTPEYVYRETKLKSISVQIVRLLCKIQTSEFPICIT